MEVSRAKNVATYIVFPIKKTDGTNISGASGLDSEIDAWSDGGAPDGFADCTNEATEIGSTGIYYLSITQAEMNYDYIVIQIKSSSSGAVPQIIVINTKDKTVIDAIKAKTDNLPASPAQEGTLTTIHGHIDDILADTAEIQTELADGGRTDLLVDAIKAKTDNLPTDPADDSDIDSQLATIYSRLGAPAGASVSADIAAAKTVIDAVNVVTDRLNGGLELNGGLYRWTAAALALAPSGSGLSEILAIAQKLDTALVLDGAVYQFTANALELAPSGSGMTEMAAILAKVETMLAAGEETDWKWTAESLIDSPVGTGGFTAADRVKLYALVTQIEENRAASAFSYSDESTDPIHKLRRMIGDTDSSDILLTDGELQIIWIDNQTFATEKENLNQCAAVACEEIASAFARDAVKAVGDLQQNLAQKSDNYRKQARVFRARQDGGEDESGSSGPGFCRSMKSNKPRFGRTSRRC